jgi:hypothetical protein
MHDIRNENQLRTRVSPGLSLSDLSPTRTEANPLLMLWRMSALVWAALMFYLSTATFGEDLSRSILTSALAFVHITLSSSGYAIVPHRLPKARSADRIRNLQPSLVSESSNQGALAEGDGWRSGVFSLQQHTPSQMSSTDSSCCDDKEASPAALSIRSGCADNAADLGIPSSRFVPGRGGNTSGVKTGAAKGH